MAEGPATFRRAASTTGRVQGRRAIGAEPTFAGGSWWRERFTWRQVVTTLSSLAGLGMSAYLTVVHYGGAPLTCPLGGTSGAINCEKVTTSPQSIVLGVPVPVLGLVFFAPMLALCLPPAWRSASRYVAPARLAASVVSIGFVLYLVYSELFVIHAICILCTIVHGLTFVVFVAVVTGWDEARTPFWERTGVPRSHR